MPDCTKLECTVPGLYDYSVIRSLLLLVDYEGSSTEEEVSLLTEDEIPLLV